MVGATRTTTQRRGLALVGLGLLLSGCFDLAKVDPGPRFIDDFDHGNLTPSWAAFDKWQCGTYLVSDLRVGQDGGADGARPDPDGSVTCRAAMPGDMPSATDQYALEAAFELNQPLDAGQQPGAAVVTRAAPGTTVDVTGFAQLWFSAYLDSAPPLPALPAGTQLQVELGCSNNKSDPLAYQPVDDLKLESGVWPMLPFQLSLAAFRVTKTTHNQDCLRQVDSIHFTIVPVLGAGTSTGGTFHLDSITLLTN